MSKKKKNKKRKNYYASYEAKVSGVKKAKKPKKSKYNYYHKPAFKEVKPSLSKKEAKEAKKIVLEPVEVPKDFKKTRTRCNHAGSLITPTEFKEMTPAYAAFTPMLDAAVESYGEDHVMVCKSCYDVLVDPGKVSVEGLKESILLMYLSVNTILSRKRLDKDEIKELTKLRDGLGDWDHAVSVLRKLEESGALQESSSAVTEEDLSKLSRADHVNPM